MPSHRVISGSLVSALLVVGAAAGCRHTIAVEPIEVKPIHMTLDINLKVDRELDEFFEDIEPASQPSTAAGTEMAPGDSTEHESPAGGQS